MDEHARHARDDLAAFDGHQVERQQGSRCHLEPAQGTADAQSRFIAMLDRHRPDRLADGIGKASQLEGLAVEHRRDRGGRDVDAVKVVQEPGDAVFRDVLLGRQVGNRRRDVRSVLDRSRHRIGKLPPCRRSAFPAAAFVGSMLGDPQRLGIGQVEHLAGLMADRIRHRHRLAAMRTNSRQVVDDGVGVLRPPQRRAGVPLLAAGLGGSRKLVVRGGFFSPSLDGGLPLLELSNPSRRSSSATRASRLLDDLVPCGDLRLKPCDHIRRADRGGRCLLALRYACGVEGSSHG